MIELNKIYNIDCLEGLKKLEDNSIILDCFMGSGTTFSVCKKNNRNFIGFEIDKHYCEITQKRLKKIENQEKLDEWF